MPIPLSRDVLPLYHDFQLRLVPNHGDVAIETDRDRIGLPSEIADLPRADAAQVLFLRDRSAQRIDELEVVGVQPGGPVKIAGDERLDPLALRSPDEVRIPSLASRVPVEQWSCWGLLELKGESA